MPGAIAVPIAPNRPRNTSKKRCAAPHNGCGNIAGLGYMALPQVGAARKKKDRVQKKEDVVRKFIRGR